MHATRVIREPDDVASRLSSFGVTVDEIYPVIEAVVAARNDVVGVDARTAAGSKAYFAGVRHMRLLFLPKGWEMDTVKGVEVVVQRELGISIVYQSVDQACVGIHAPQAISGKGPAAEAVIKAAQGGLFTEEELPQVPSEKIKDLNRSVWFLCVSVNPQDPEDVRAELSLPASIEGRNFKGFLERIFIVRSGDWKSRGPVAMRPDEGDHYEFSIARK